MATNTTWCVYHDKALIDEYNLQETENFKLFYTREKRYTDVISLNYAQSFFNEFAALYYVWKNNLKSDIVTFCHYRRVITDDMIDIDYILQNRFQTYYALEFDTLNGLFNKVGLTYSFSVLLSFIKDKLNCYSLLDYLHFINSKDVKIVPGCEIFSSTWEEFDRMMKFMDHFLKYFLNYHGIEETDCGLHEIPLYKYKAVCQLVNDMEYGLWENNFMPETNTKFSGFPRTIGFMIEILIGIWFRHFSKKLV